MRALQRVLVDQDLADRRARARSLLTRSSARRTSYPGVVHDPGHGDDLVAADDERPGLALRPRHLRVDEHVLDLLAAAGEPVARRASRALEARDARTRSSSRPSDRAVERDRAPARARRWSYSRTATTPPPRSTRFEPSGEASSSSSARSTARGSAAGSLERARGGSARRPGGAAAAAAGSRRGSGRASCRGSTSRRGTRAPRRGSTPRSPRARRVSSGRTTPSSRRAWIPRGRAARDEAVEDRLDLVGGGVPGRAQAVRRERVAQVAQLGLGAAGAGASTTSAPSRSRQKRASASDSSPRSPWFTCSAETR